MTIRKIMQKLNSCAGESIVEVLCAILIVALGAVILLTMVLSSTKMIERSQKSISEMYNKSNEAVITAPEEPKIKLDKSASNNVTIIGFKSSGSSTD